MDLSDHAKWLRSFRVDLKSLKRNTEYQVRAFLSFFLLLLLLSVHQILPLSNALKLSSPRG